MTENSKIEWCDHTFNPWMGCAKVAPGCTHCYAEALMDTRYGAVKWGENGTRVKTSKANWNKVRKWNREAQCSCGAAGAFGRECAWCANGGKSPRVFCASLADVAEDRPELAPWRAELCDLIRECDNLDFLLLTKRPENLTRLFPSDVLERCWNGTSISDQATADRNIPILLQVPSARRFVSAEPLVEAVDLSAYLWRTCSECSGRMHVGPDGSACNCAKYSPRPGYERRNELHWIIAGGESGPNARPCDVAWIRSIVEQCKAAGVPCFVKQLGARPSADFYDEATYEHWEYMGREWPMPDDWDGVHQPLINDTCTLPLADRKGADPSEWPADLRVREWPEVTRG